MIYVQGNPRESEEADQIIGAAHKRRGAGGREGVLLQTNTLASQCCVPPSLSSFSSSIRGRRRRRRHRRRRCLKTSSFLSRAASATHLSLNIFSRTASTAMHSQFRFIFSQRDTGERERDACPPPSSQLTVCVCVRLVPCAVCPSTVAAGARP